MKLHRIITFCLVVVFLFTMCPISMVALAEETGETTTETQTTTDEESLEATTPEGGHFHDGVEYLPLTSADQLIAGGAYYLADDVTLDKAVLLPDGVETSICLNGKTLKSSYTAGATFQTKAANAAATFNIDDCTANTDADGVYHAGAIDGMQNKITGHGGGAFMIRGKGTLNFYNGKITNCTAVVGGGAIFANGAVNLYGGELSGNKAVSGTAAKNGGAIYVNNYATNDAHNGVLYAENVVFKDNDAPYGAGGAVYAGGPSEFKNCKFIDNNAGTTGGAIHIARGNTTFDGCEMTGNSANAAGAINLSTSSATLTIKDTTITENVSTSTSAEGSGAAVYVTGSASKVTLAGKTYIHDNSIDADGIADLFINSSGDGSNEKVYVKDLNGYVKFGVKDTAASVTEASDVVAFDGEASTYAGASVSYMAGTEEKHVGLVDGTFQFVTGHFHKGVEYTAWTDTTSLPTEGNWYLDTDVTVTSEVQLKAHTLNLCLNGHTVKGYTGNGARAYSTTAMTAAEINISDCTAKTVDGVYTAGKFTGFNNTHTNSGGSAIYIRAGSHLNFFDGIIEECNAASGGAIYVHTATANIYNGLITDNTAKAGETWKPGAGLFLYKSTVHVENAQFTKNEGGYGTAICPADGSCVLTLKDVTVTDNTIHGEGAVHGAYTALKLTISGDTVIDGNLTASGAVSNLRLASTGNIIVEDLGNKAKVGVTVTGVRAFSNALTDTFPELLDKFTSDSDDYLVVQDEDGRLVSRLNCEVVGHSWIDATCTVPKTCTVCGATEGDVVHSWVVATCTTPKTCSACGATEGEALGHSWVEASCTAPRTCSVCNATEGEALGHSWVEATCTVPKTCSVCNATEGEALGHSWKSATCTAPKTCSVCSATEGEPLGHSYVKGVCSVCSYAHPVTGTCGDNLAWNLDDKGTLTISGTGAMYDYDTNDPDSMTSVPWANLRDCIQKVIIEEGVTTICNYAFYGCTELTDATIPAGVTSVGDFAFKDCYSLTSASLPEGVTYIGNHAFSLCYNLEETNIPASVQSIGFEAYYRCGKITGITLPDSLTYMDAFAFRGCTGLTAVTIPAGLTGIETGAFAECTGLTVVTIPEGVTTIGAAAFSDCTALTEINIPGSMTEIGFNAFANCTGLKRILIPSGVTAIGEAAFYGCTGLTEMQVEAGNPVFHSAGNCIVKTADKTLIAGCKTSVIPSDGSVTCIGVSAFNGCTTVTDIVIPNTVTSLEDYAFYGCAGLTSITIPDSVTGIGDYVFYECTGLKHVFYTGTETQKAAITIGSSNTPLTDATWHYEVQEVVLGGETYYYCKECNKTFSVAGQEMKGTVKFLDADGSVISETVYPYGKPINIPADPTKATDKTATYTFAGWDKEISTTCAGDATYTATYTLTYIEYTVAFMNWDGSLISSKTYHYGDTVEIPGAPGKVPDKTFYYIFTGWNKTVVNCTGNATYTAVYSPMYIDYTVTFLDWDGTKLAEKTCHYGETVEPPADPTRPDGSYITYEFAGWTPELQPCQGNATYTATYRENIFLQDALQEAAQTGGTVKLTQDTQVDYLTIGNGATLDLNGYTLTADYFTSYGTVVDGTIGGNALVKVNKGIHLATENEFMPIYDSANGGYRFYKYELQNLGYKTVDSGTVKAGFRLTFANTSGYDVLSTTTDVALDTVALVSWTGSMGVTHYTFSDDTLRNYAAMAAADIASKGSTSKAMTLTLTGVDSLGENASVQFQPTVETAPGMIAQGADKTWTAQ